MYMLKSNLIKTVNPLMNFPQKETTTIIIANTGNTFFLKK